MPNQTLVRGLFLACVALAFGLGALQYPLGDFARAGPGLFPLLVSGLLLAVALLTILQSRASAPVPIRLNLKNIGCVLLGLASFVLCSKLIDMAVGIVALVFIAALAGSAYRPVRNLQVAAVLIAIAWVFQRFLGLNLRLI